MPIYPMRCRSNLCTARHPIGNAFGAGVSAAGLGSGEVPLDHAHASLGLAAERELPIEDQAPEASRRVHARRQRSRLPPGSRDLVRQKLLLTRTATVITLTTVEQVGEVLQ